MTAQWPLVDATGPPPPPPSLTPKCCKASHILMVCVHSYGLCAFTWFACIDMVCLDRDGQLGQGTVYECSIPLAVAGLASRKIRQVTCTFHIHRACSRRRQHAPTLIPPGCMRRHAHAAPRRRRQIARIWQVREPTQSTPPSTPSFASFTSQQNTRPICSDTLQRRQWPPRSGQHHYHCKAGRGQRSRICKHDV